MYPLIATVAVLPAVLTATSIADDKKPQEVKSEKAPLREALIKAAKGADAVRLEWYEFVGDDPEAKSRSKDIGDPKEVAALLAAFRFQENRGTVQMDAEFSTHLTLRSGGKTLAKLRFEGLYLLRWTDGAWKGDAILTMDASKEFCQWLARHGIPGWERMRVARERELASQRRRFDGMIAAFPKDCEETFRKPLRPRMPIHEGDDEDVKGHADELAKKVGSSAKLAACVFRAYGADDRDPGWYDIYDILMRNLMARCNAADFRAALEEVKNDQKALAGAARFGLEDRYGELPEASRAEWTIRLARALLTEGSPGGKRKALAVLAGLTKEEAREAMRQALKTPAPPSSENPQQKEGSEPSLRAAAGFWLGAAKDQAAIPALRTALTEATTDSDKIVLRIGLQMSGAEPLVLRPEDFKTQSTLVAEAVARAAAHKDGREGMEFLVTHGLGASAWFINHEAAQGIRVIAQRSFPDGPPPPTGERDFEALAKWWKDHPARNAKGSSK